MTKPDPPQNAIVSNLTARSLTISWDPPVSWNGGTTQGYAVNQYKGWTPNFATDLMHVYDISGTTLNITGLTPGTKYQFYLWSYNGVFSDQVGPFNELTDAGCWIRHNGQWVSATPYVRSGGIWKQAQPFVRVAGEWKTTY